MNPGFDLLLAIDWEEQLASGGERLVTPAAATAPEGPPVLLPIPAGAPPATVTVNAPVVVHSYGMGFTAKLLLVGAAGLVGLVLIVVLVAASQSAPRRD